MPGVKNSQAAKRQPAKRGLSQAARRVKHVYLPFGLRISLRRFRTSPTRRSKAYRQFVIQTNLFSLREIAFASLKQPPKPAVQKNKLAWLYGKWAIAPMLFIILGLSGAAYSATHLSKSVRLDLNPSAKASASGEVISQQAAHPKVLPRALPLHIRIPSIGVDTDIVPVGLNQDDSIAMPPSVDVGAWYSGSPTPGELGPAIIAGHVDNYKGIGAFFRLREMQAGQLIYIDRADGSTATFKVADIKQVPQANFPTQEVFGNINYAGLRVITCGGAFNTSTHEYEDNIVVFAILQ
jgi:sortase (surface protein transpeptidase)